MDRSERVWAVDNGEVGGVKVGCVFTQMLMGGDELGLQGYPVFTQMLIWG